MEGAHTATPVQEHARTVQKEAYDFARTAGVPESLKGTEGDILAAGIVDQCKNGDLNEEQLQAFVLWNIELYSTSIPRQMPNQGTAG